MSEVKAEKKFKRCKEPSATRVCDRCEKEIPPGHWFYVRRKSVILREMRRKSVILREMAELIRNLSRGPIPEVFLCEECFKKKQRR